MAQHDFTAAVARLPLVRHCDEHGTDLLDLPDLPLPSASTPLPARLLARWDQALLAHAERERVEVTVVFDGREHARVSAAAPGIEVRFAPGGPDSADREIVRLIRADPDPGSILAVSSDRRLRNSVKAAGAAGMGSGELLRVLDQSEAEAGRPRSP